MVIALLAAACTVPVPMRGPGGADVAGPREAIAAYERVLDRFVDDRGAVDFEALSRDRGDLDNYIRYIAATPLESFRDGDERLAHYINSYNALSMWNVVESGIPRTHAGWHKVFFFWVRRFMIGGRRMSLYAYENDIIRKVGDARVHFALNCSAIGCPRLPRQPFAGGNLPAELERGTRSFFSSPEHLRIVPADHAAYVSELLRFYSEDFIAHAGSVRAFVNRYSAERIPDDFDIRFIPYDWTIANARRR
jgi:uncharacterized protein DUF547